MSIRNCVDQLWVGVWVGEVMGKGFGEARGKSGGWSCGWVRGNKEILDWICEHVTLKSFIISYSQHSSLTLLSQNRSLVAAPSIVGWPRRLELIRALFIIVSSSHNTFTMVPLFLVIWCQTNPIYSHSEFHFQL